MELNEAIRALSAAGAVVVVSPGKHLSLASAAVELDCSTKWVREHLREFPNAWRMPGGELRIPKRDVDALAERKKIKKAT